MDEATFKNALRFARFLGVSVYVISGGEPTEHPQFLHFCELLDRFINGSKHPGCFTVTSNGTWFPDKKEMVEKLTKLKYFSGMQVYTNPKWYKSAEFILQNREEINAIPKVLVDTTDIRSMQDLRRARVDERAQKEIASNPHYMSCLNGHLLFRQVNSTTKIFGMDMQPGMMCRPLIDYKGNVHLSESHLCPSYGNVNENYWKDIFKNLQDSKPCYKCSLSKKFLTSSDSKISMARNILK